MAIVDSQSDTVVVRVVYDGAPLAGKTTSVRTLARVLCRDVVVPAEADGRTLYFDWLDYTAGIFEGRRVRCQVVTVPGQAALAARRDHLLAGADAVVFVGDTTPDACEAACRHLTALHSHLAATPDPPVGVVFQANKRDHPEAVPLHCLRDRLDAAGVPVAIVESIATTGDGVREAFVFAVRLALDRVRALMHAGRLETGVPEVASADDLLAQLNALSEDGDVLDALVHAMQPTGSGSTTEPATGSAAAVRTRRPRRRPGAAPSAPTSDLPSGLIWPPVTGRLLMHEAAAAVGKVRADVSGDWNGTAGRNWIVQSPAESAFLDVESGRTALVEWAGLHAAGAGVVSERRCIALAADGQGGYRLWQFAAIEPSLRDELAAALDLEPEAIAAALLRAATALAGAARHWKACAPCQLPLSLRRVSAGPGRPRYVGPMPFPATPTDRWGRKEADVWKTLAVELAFVLSAIGSARPAIVQALDAQPHHDGDAAAHRFLRGFLSASA